MAKSKFCPSCKLTKLLSEFWKHKGRKDGVQSICKVCHLKLNKHKDKEKARVARVKCQNSSRVKLRKRDYDLKHYYNITLAEYDQMFEDQKGVCAICGNPENNRRLAVDHDHKTGKVRGLLCTRCNVKLDWSIRFGSMITDYLQEY